MRRLVKPAFFFLLNILLLLVGSTAALATGHARSEVVRVRRQDTFVEPKTITTAQTTNLPEGPHVQTCVITFTPIKDDDGNDAVREVAVCRITPVSSSSNAPSPTGSPATTARSATTSAAPSPDSATSATPSPSSTTTSPSSTSASPSPTPPTITTETPSISVNGVSTVTPDSSAPAPAAATTTDGVGPANNATQSSAASSQSAFAMPGKKLSVLPIGLGVFAGISVIALVVVGLVTYERTKYRKAFRQRKLAEAGAGMGYGGMAQRT